LLAIYDLPKVQELRICILWSLWLILFFIMANKHKKVYIINAVLFYHYLSEMHTVFQKDWMLDASNETWNKKLQTGPHQSLALLEHNFSITFISKEKRKFCCDSLRELSLSSTESGHVTSHALRVNFEALSWQNYFAPKEGQCTAVNENLNVQ
jgi:membrane-bound metal-dependent hydrolase YbcI (DUF457 family)